MTKAFYKAIAPQPLSNPAGKRRNTDCQSS